MDVKQEQEVFVKIAEHEEKIKVTNHRLKDLEEHITKVESLTLSVEKLAFAVENMAKEQIDYRSKQNELAKRILEVEQLPNKRKANILDKYLGQILAIIIGALISYLLFSLLGLQS